jgi:hypothetical protein
METESCLARIGAVAAILGPVVLLGATLAHPMESAPNDLASAFAEYARDPYWVASHLLQVLGLTLVAAGLVALAGAMEAGWPAALARLGVLATAASVSLGAVLQAVDGVALKVMATRWMAARGEPRQLAFEGAVAVRQIEVGLASLLSIVFGLTLALFGAALIRSRRFPAWLGWLGVLAGAGTMAAGVVAAYEGFSDLNMLLTSITGPLASLWAVCVGVALWRIAPQLARRAAPPAPAPAPAPTDAQRS